MALDGFDSHANLNLLGTEGFVAVVVSLVIALQLPICRKALGVKQWGYNNGLVSSQISALYIC
jgi:hypothetical protein